MAEFILEVRSEEIPARMVAGAARRLAGAFFETLATRGLPPDEVESHFTVRRLIVRLQGLAERERDREEEEIGPPSSVAWDASRAPTPALAGFAQRCGVTVDDVVRQQTPKGEYAAVTRRVEGQPMVDILSDLAPRLIAGLEWGKPMRWGESVGPWVRPIRGVVAVFNGTVVPFEIFSLASGNQTIGHPVLSPEPFAVGDWDGYRRALEERGIVIDADARRQQLATGFEAAAEAAGGRLVDDPALLEQLAAMVEIPGVVVGECDPTGLPGEVLTASLRDHQNAFGVVNQGGPLPVFVTVMDRADDPQELVRQGNEWVVAARLEDARFFVGEDRKRSLEDRRPELERLTFHRQLGTYADKTERLVGYGDWLCELTDHRDLIPAMKSAASLAKVDLTSEVVKEFTSLQGVMGGVYAREQGLDEEVASAIYQQYRPASTEEPIPECELACLLGVADRMVTLGGFFAVGEVPSGSRDPYGLRRSAQGVVEIVLGADLRVQMQELAAQAIAAHDGVGTVPAPEATEQLTRFLEDRLRSLLGRRGFAYDEVAAAVAVDSLPVAALARVEALNEARRDSGFADVADAAKRIRNILDGQAQAAEISVDTFQLEEEQQLWDAVTAGKEAISSAVERLDYQAAIGDIAGFAPVLERFFETVLVMDDEPDIRGNRLALLAMVDRLFAQVGDLSQLAVERKSG